LSSCLQLLRLSPTPERIPFILDTGEKAIRRATELTAQMRSFARVQDVRLEAVDLVETIHNIMPLLASSLRNPRMLRTELADDLWPVNIDRLQFELALLNLVINARDAMPRGGEIVLTCANAVLTASAKAVAPGEYVVVAVADQGTGIPAELLSKVLDPFFTTKPVDKGTGLGLPQAYGFATQAGGTLLIDSSEGSGTTVTMYLPRSAHKPDAAVGAPGEALAPREENGTVLFVEDDPLVRQTVLLALEHSGFKVIEAASGDEALVLLEANASVEFVFSDVVMPGEVNGVELARIVAARYPHLHVVLASGHNELEIDLEKVKLIGKPYDVVSVVNMLVSLRTIGGQGSMRP
jgi:CheY-like chemotaxis protein